MLIPASAFFGSEDDAPEVDVSAAPEVDVSALVEGARYRHAARRVSRRVAVWRFAGRLLVLAGQHPAAARPLRAAARGLVALSVAWL